MMINSELLKEYVNYICVKDNDVMTKKSILHTIKLVEDTNCGEWLWLGDNPNPNHKYSCNKCGRSVKEQENFCPNCGIMMKKGGAL